ncbi:MAG TPA: ATP-binding cassette domain-containing protein [Ornithinibacter sp.]|nr:ATP-binding cassette domain-containing protein [Ornithinibacter sp.]
MTDSQPAIDAREVSVSYGSRQLALHGVTLHAGHGVLGLLGPNGAGKSTLLSVLATVLRPTAGSVLIGGHDIHTRGGRHAARALLGWLPQRFDLAGGMTALETVAYAAWANGCDAKAADHRAAEALGLVDMSGLASTRVRRLSGGQRQRLGLAAAMAHDPSVLLLDEPTVGLDPEQRVKFRASIRRAASRRTIVLSSHLLEDIAHVCDRVAVLHQGEIRFTGTPTELAALATGDVDTSDDGLTNPLEAGYLHALRSDDA